MNHEILKRIERIKDMFPTAFIHNKEELILDKKRNVYFRLPDVKTVYDFDYKFISYCSFYCADNHFKRSSQTSKYFLNRINRYFRKEFTIDDLQLIYMKIGTGANRPLGIEFIESGLDLDILNSEGGKI